MQRETYFGGDQTFTAPATPVEHPAYSHRIRQQIGASQTLRVTPAREADLVDHVWNLGKTVALLDSIALKTVA
jgi:hypothetical protein